MAKGIMGLLVAVELFALANRGGGPLLSHLALTGVVFLICCFGLARRGELRFNFGFPQAAYALFLLFFLISLVFSLTPEFSLAELLLFGNAGILLILLSGLRTTERDLFWFAVFIVAVAVADALMGFFIYTQTPFPRFAGTFIDLKEPYISTGNDFANFLLLIMPLAGYLLFLRHSRVTTTILTVAAFAILMAGFLLSFSRAAWMSFLALAVITVVWLILRRKKLTGGFQQFAKGWRIILRIFCVIIIAALLITGAQTVRGKQFETTPLLKKLLFQADEGAGSASERWQYWQGAVKLIKERPLFGGGILSFKYLYPRHQTLFGTGIEHPHNIFLKIAVENGAAASVLFAIFLIAVFAAVLRFLRITPAHIIFPFSLGALGALGHNLLDFNFITANFTLFMVFIALALSLAHCGWQVKRLALYLCMICAASLFLVLLGMHEGFYNIDFKRGRAELESGNLEKAVYHLERAEKLFFERDRVNYLASAYQRQGSREKEENLLLKAVKNRIDASLNARLGQIYLEEKRLEEAEEQFKAALARDPQNNLCYYYNMLNLRSPAPPDLRQKTLVLLNEYKDFLRNNRHFTVLTKNPSCASKLYELFGMGREREELNGIWFNELLKFTMRYGPIKKP